MGSEMCIRDRGAVSGLSFMSPGSVDDDAFVAFILALGILAMATNAIVIGNVSDAVSRVHARSHKENEARDAIADALMARQVPSALRERIMDFYVYAGGCRAFKTLTCLTYQPRSSSSWIFMRSVISSSRLPCSAKSLCNRSSI